MTPGRNNRGSFSFIDGNVNGRELFVTTRKPAAKRGRAKVKDISGDTPKRGRTRKRAEPSTPAGTPRTPKRKTPVKQPQLPVQDIVDAANGDAAANAEAGMDELEVIDMMDGTETSQADMEEETQDLSDTEQETQAYSETDVEPEESRLPNPSDYDIETPTTIRTTHTQQRQQEGSPLPVEPYRSFHSTPPSPIYEEYQVPIPTSSSPPRPSSQGLSSPSTPYLRTPLPTPISHDIIHDRIRRRARSRSASRERRMSIVPTPWQGLPSTPGRGTSTPGYRFAQRRREGSVSEEETLSTETRQETRPQVAEVRQTVYNMESMTPVRNWAAEIAEGAFRFDKSPSKMIQLPIQQLLPRAQSPLQSYQDNDPVQEAEHDGAEDLYGDDPSRDDEVIVHISDLEDEAPIPIPPKSLPQLARLRNSGQNSPIVITSSPPEQQLKQIHYQWKTIIPDTPTPASSIAPTPRANTPTQTHSREITSSPPTQDIPTNDIENTPSPHPDPNTSSPPHLSPRGDSIPEVDMLSLSQCRISSRNASPARSIISQLGADDVVDISSKSPQAAKRAARILLQSHFFEKIDFKDDNEGSRIWDEVTANAGEYDISRESLTDPDELSDERPDEDKTDAPDEDIEVDAEDEEGVMDIDSPSPARAPPPQKISHGEWTKLDWKRLEKCLDHSNGDSNDTIDLFQQRYMGREREELEMRCKAVLLARRRRNLEGRKVEFILGTSE